MRPDELGLWKTFWRAKQRAAKDRARRDLVEHYLPFVRDVAAGVYRTLPRCSNVELDDLVAWGFVGLNGALDKFREDRGATFKTFALLRIRGAMLDGLRQADWASRLDRQKEARGEKVLPRHLSLGMLCGRPANEQSHEDEGRLYRLEPADAKQPPPCKALFDRRDFFRLLKGLNLAERQMLIGYYALNQTMKEIGRGLGLSESRVSQMHSQVLARLRAKLTAERSDAVESGGVERKAGPAERNAA